MIIIFDVLNLIQCIKLAINLLESTKRLITTVILIISLFYSSNIVLADDITDFDRYMSEWISKKELAGEYLLKAENEFEAGDELSACATQKEASELGISATKALIQAMKINGTIDSIENLNAGVDKWKEIGDVCGSIIN